MGEKNSSNSSSEPTVKLLVVLSGEKKACSGLKGVDATWTYEEGVCVRELGVGGASAADSSSDSREA